jgi:grpE
MNNPFSNKSDKSSQAKAHSQTRGDAFDSELNPNTFEDPEFKPDIEEGNPKHSANSTTNSAKDLEEIAKLARQNSELIGDLQRTRADFENFRKQVELQREQAKTIAKHTTISKVLPLIDDMSRAIKAHPDLLAPVQKTLDKTLKALNLAPIDSTPGTAFNPEFHNAITMEEGDGDKEVIAEELIPGYLYEGEVLRAAMVRVKHQ